MADRPLVYISFAQEDSRWEDRLWDHLSGFPIERVGYDSVPDGNGGYDFSLSQRQMEAARVAVLLVSPAYLTSERIQTEELPILLRRKGLQILPVLVSAISNRQGWLRRRRVLPRLQGLHLTDQPSERHAL